MQLLSAKVRRAIVSKPAFIIFRENENQNLEIAQLNLKNVNIIPVLLNQHTVIFIYLFLHLTSVNTPKEQCLVLVFLF
jgi:hypothetical protein